MKKRLSVFLLAMVMILSVCPCISVSAATTSDVVIYDAYISGNFVVGETLTANYSVYPENCETLDATNTNATITWYAINRYGTSSSTKIVTLGTGKTYKIPSNYLHTSSDETDETVLNNANAHSIYFTVTPMSADNLELGDMAYSNLGKHVVASSATEAPAAFNATIVPQNASGSMCVGDTLVARYVYQEPSGVEEGDTTYAWYTRDSLSGERALVQEASTSKTYVLKSGDVGKWIEVDITPISAKEKEGTTVTTKNHYGNAFYTNGADVVTSNKFYGSKYDRVRMMADGNQYTSATSSRTSAGYFLSSSATTYHTGTEDTTSDAYVVFDMGKCVSFDGFYVKRAMQDAPVMEISYSQYNGEITASTLSDANWKKVATLSNPAKEVEYEMSEVEYARYFKITIKSSESANFPKDADIMDFYAFRRSDSAFEYDANFAEIENDKVIISAWGTPKSEIIQKIISDSSDEVNVSFIDAEKNEITDDFVVDENLTDTYLTFTGTKNIPTTFEITYRGDIVNSEEVVDITSNTPIVNNVSFTGGENGKIRTSFKLFVPEGCSPSVNVYTGGTKWVSTAAAIQYPIWFDDASSKMYYGSAKATSYKYEKNMWHDVEILFDYSTFYINKLGYMKIYLWVDGTLVSSRDRDFNYPNSFVQNHIHVSIGSGITGATMPYTSPTTEKTIQVKDVVLREMYEIKSLVTPPEYTVSLMDDTTAVEKIGVNKSYTMAEDLGVYHVNTVNYLATYDVTYDADGAEIKRQLVALDGAVKADGEVAAVSFGDSISTENADGTVTKKEVKAFSFAPDMVANAKAGVWKAE